MKYYFANSLILGMFLAHSPFGLLQAEEKERIVVSASRQKESLKSVPSTVQVLGKDDLDRLAGEGASLGEILGRLVPGLGAPTQSVSSYGQTLRGREALIVIDGIPQSENRQVSRQLGTIRPELIERIEVISGANAVYGSGAPGGVIHIFTRTPSDRELAFSTKLGVSVADRPMDSRSAVYDASQEVSGTLGEFQYLAAVGVESRANSFDAKGKQIAPEPAQTSSGDSLAREAMVKLAWALSEKSSLELNGQFYSSEQDSKYYAALAPYRAESGLELSRQPLSSRYQLSLNYTQNEFLGQELSVIAYHRARLYRFFPFALTQPVPLVNQSESKAALSGIKLSLSSQINDQVSLIWGVDYEQESGSQSARSYDYAAYQQSAGRVYENPTEPYDYGPDVDTQKTGIFAQFKWLMMEDLQSRFGLRYELISQKVHDFNPPLETALQRNWGTVLARAGQLEAAGQIPSGTVASLPSTYPLSSFPGGTLDYDAKAFNLGMTYDLSPAQSLFFQASQGYELADTARLMRDAIAETSLLPTVGPLFKLSLTTSTVEDLEAATIGTSNFEMGWRGIWSSFSGNFAIFFNQSDKTYRFNRDFTVDLLKQKKRIYGYETDLNWRLSESYSLGTSYSSSKGEMDTDSGEEALPAVEVSPAKWTVFTEYRTGSNFNLRVQLAQLSDYTASEIDTDGYSVVDAFATYHFALHSRLQAGVENVLGENYKTIFHQWAEETYGQSSGAPASGRRISLAYLVEF